MRTIYSASPYMKLLKEGWPKNSGQCVRINNTHPEFGDWFDVHYLVTLPQFKFLKGKFGPKIDFPGGIEGTLSRLALRFRYAAKSHVLASYNPKAGEITINVAHVIDRSEDDISNLITHELTHALQDFAKEQYQSFRGKTEYLWTTHEKEAYMTMAYNMLANGKSEEQVKEYFVNLVANPYKESEKREVRRWAGYLIDAVYQEMEYREKPLREQGITAKDGKFYYSDGTEIPEEDLDEVIGPRKKFINPRTEKEKYPEGEFYAKNPQNPIVPENKKTADMADRMFDAFHFSDFIMIDGDELSNGEIIVQPKKDEKPFKEYIEDALNIAKDVNPNAEYKGTHGDDTIILEWKKTASNLKLKLARTPEERAWGYMYQESEEPDHGILFVNEKPCTQGRKIFSHGLFFLSK